MDAETATRIATAAFGSSVGRLRPLGNGEDFDTFVTGDDLVLRFPRREACSTLLVREYELLEHLAAQSLPADTPRFTDITEPCNEFPWHIAAYRLVRGRSLDEVDASAQRAIARDLGEFLAALHCIAPPGPLPQPWADWDPSRAAAINRFERAANIYPRALRQRLAHHLAQPAPAEPASAPVLIHGDLFAEHILVSEDGRLSGIIDWTDAHIAHRVLDFAGLLEVDTDLLAPAFESYGIEPEGAERIWLLNHIVHTTIEWIEKRVDKRRFDSLPAGFALLDRLLAEQERLQSQ